MNIFRFREGKVVELWNHRDDLGLMQQLGAEIYAGAAPTDDKGSQLELMQRSARVTIQV